MKYTAQQIREQKISFKDLTKEQFNKLKEHFQKLYPNDRYNSYPYHNTHISWRFYPIKMEIELPIHSISFSYFTHWGETYKSTKEITFNEFDFEELTELPKYWVVKNDGSQLFKDTVIKYINDNSGLIWSGKASYYGYDGNTSNNGFDYWGNLSNFRNNPTELTLEQFIKLTNMNKDKKIIGYKLKDKFKENYETISNIISENCTDSITEITKGILFEYSSIYEERARNIEVLDLWFEPVYKSKEEIVSMNGQFSLKVTRDGIFHNNENITEYVAEVLDWVNSIPIKFGKYDFHYSEIKLSKTGCESKETKISDWINVWKKYKEAQL